MRNLNLSKLYLLQLSKNDVLENVKIALFNKILKRYGFEDIKLRLDKETKDKILKKEAETTDYFCDPREIL